MALSTRPPPPSDPPSTTPITTTPTNTTTTVTVPRPVLSNPNPRPSPSPPPPSHHTLPHPHLYQPHPSLPSSRPPPNHPHQQLNNNNNNNFLYPLASSGRGRGFLSKHSPVTVPNTSPTTNPNLNPNIFSARPGLVYQRPQAAYDRANLDPGLVQSGQLGQGFGFIRPQPHLQHTLAGSSSSSGAGGVMPAALVKGVPLSKMGLNQATIPDTNGRDRIRDDSFVIIRDRKVKITENASLYSLCRSWLKNGFPEETQPQYIDIPMSLPKPLPLATEDTQLSPTNIEQEKEEDEGSIENLSPKELLQRHVNRAKKVRSRLREERLKRIARYKTRLGLLLPPTTEQHFRNESTNANGNGNI